MNNDTNSSEFVGFQKIPRLSREIWVLEKLDGTNAQILIEEVIPPLNGAFTEDLVRMEDAWAYSNIEDGRQYRLRPGSSNRWITPSSDNAGFAGWVFRNVDVLKHLGPGRHFGEWWGAGIQRRYGLDHKRFSLFNADRWGWLNDVTPEQNPLAGLVGVVPVLYKGPFSTEIIEGIIDDLRTNGSHAAPGFMDPEGVVVYHTASGHLYKKTCHKDESPKGPQPE